MRKPLTLSVLGAGNRSQIYCRWAARFPDRFQVAAAADPNPIRLDHIARVSGNPNLRRFRDDVEFLAAPRQSEVVIIGTQDAQHADQAVGALNLGYDILLEKPIASRLEDVARVYRHARKWGRRILVCHVLRYSPFYRRVHEIVRSGALGKIVSLQATEGVEPWHFVHSYVRGPWSQVEKSSPVLLAKSCHDLDIISWLLDEPCVAVSSFGSNLHFSKENQPQGAPRRCVEGCPVEDSCLYNAKLYLTKHRNWLYPLDRGTHTPDAEIRRWLAESRHGLCAYDAEQTTLDHQVVSATFASGATAGFTLTAFDSGRSIEIHGTRARLRGGEFMRRRLGCDLLIEHHGGHVERVELPAAEGGHGGADLGLVEAIYDEFRAEDPAEARTSIEHSLESHMMGFAAELSRTEARVIQLDEVRKGFL
jgi:predicted dehydrogenase